MTYSAKNVAYAAAHDAVSTQPAEEKPRYINLDEDLIGRLIDANLTAAEYKLFLFLSQIDPFGNRFIEIGVAFVQKRLGLSKSTYYAAKAKLQKLGLFDFEDVIIRIRNLNGAKAPERQSEKSDTSPKNRTPVRKIGHQSEKSDSQAPEPSQEKASSDPHYLSISNQYSSIEERERKAQKCSGGKPKVKDESSLPSTTPLLPFKQNPKSDAIATHKDLFFATVASTDSELLEFVFAKVCKFTNPVPQFPLVVAVSMLQHQSHVLEAEFERHKAAIAARATPAPDQTREDDTPEGRRVNRLAMYQAMWTHSRLKSIVRQRLAEHPEYGIELGPEGPREVAF